MYDLTERRYFAGKENAPEFGHRADSIAQSNKSGVVGVHPHSARNPGQPKLNCIILLLRFLLPSPCTFRDGWIRLRPECFVPRASSYP